MALPYGFEVVGVGLWGEAGEPMARPYRFEVVEVGVLGSSPRTLGRGVNAKTRIDTETVVPTDVGLRSGHVLAQSFIWNKS